jgi:peroxiredoxin
MRLPLLLTVLLALAACGAPRHVSDAWKDGTPRRAGSLKGPKQIGVWTYNHQGGAKAASGAFVSNMQDGPWTLWHPNGQKSAEGAYGAGLKEGTWIYFRADGSRQATGSYRADRQEGPWTSYHADGATPSAIAWFRRGLWDGPYATFAADGSRLEAGVMLAGTRALWLGLGEQAPLGSAEVGTPGAIAVRGRDGATRLGLDAAWLTLDAAGRVASLGAAPAPEPPPQQAISSMSMSIPAAELPPALPAPVSDPVLPPAAADLSPIATLPGWWTADQEAGAAKLLARYSGKQPSPQEVSSYDEAPVEVSRARPVWHGKALPQTRYLGSDGKVLDLALWRGRKVVLVVMRGFSGQICVYCATQTAALADAAARLRAAGVETLVVYPGPPAAVPAFINAVASLRGSPPPLPVALDAGLTLVRGLEIAGNLSLPATFILDRDGLVRWTYVGTSIADRPSVPDIEKALAGVP